MTTGIELLAVARGMGESELASVFGGGVSSSSDVLDRPALVVALLSEYRASDIEVIRAITRYEIEQFGELTMAAAARR